MDSSSYTELDHTLDEDAWKDSFDKLLDVKPLLRDLKVIKKDIRVSFNNDSSVENSRELSNLFSKNNQKTKSSLKKLPTRISTPVSKLPRQPFKCSISPITQWKIHMVKMNKKKDTPLKMRTLQSTVINPEVVVIDFDDENEKNQRASELISVKEASFNDLLKKRKSKRVTGLRQVLFDNNVQRKSLRNSIQNQQKDQLRNSSPIKQRTSRKRSTQTKNSRKTTDDKTLQPGKWRKSLSIMRRSQLEKTQVQRNSQRIGHRLEAIIDICDDDESVEFIDAIPPSKYVGRRKTIAIKPELTNDSDFVVQDYQKLVLECCNQTEIVTFHDFCNQDTITDCYKIGEGVYGEVFLKKVFDEKIVCKIIPIEGTVPVNGEVQKTFELILPEIVISKELYNLKDMKAENATCGFVGVKKVSCIKGKYPDQLIKYWEKYEIEKGSDNDHPGAFLGTQLYVVLELEFAGQDLESFLFENAEQSFAALKQIVLTLAVAEEALEFEHRDLHWGNVLISPTNDSKLTYKLSGETITLLSMGIKATIIDYTLSRMKYKTNYFYNDLSNDEELFTATGDYQFDIYRMMRDLLGTHWERFEPKTNVYWISYIISKMTNGIKYKNTRSKGHTQYLRKMRSLKNESLEYSSACKFAKHLKNL